MFRRVQETTQLSLGLQMQPSVEYENNPCAIPFVDRSWRHYRTCCGGRAQKSVLASATTPVVRGETIGDHRRSLKTRALLSEAAADLDAQHLVDAGVSETVFLAFHGAVVSPSASTHRCITYD